MAQIGLDFGLKNRLRELVLGADAGSKEAPDGEAAFHWSNRDRSHRETSKPNAGLPATFVISRAIDYPQRDLSFEGLKADIQDGRRAMAAL